MYTKIGGVYYKFRLNGSEVFNKIFGVGIFENLLAAKIEGNYILLVVSQFLLVIGNIIANYRSLGQDIFIRETILMTACSFLQNRRFCLTLKSAIFTHFRNRRFCLIFEIGGFVAFKISCFVLPPCTLTSFRPTDDDRRVIACGSTPGLLCLMKQKLPFLIK